MNENLDIVKNFLQIVFLKTHLYTFIFHSSFIKLHKRKMRALFTLLDCTTIFIFRIIKVLKLFSILHVSLEKSSFCDILNLYPFNLFYFGYIKINIVLMNVFKLT